MGTNTSKPTNQGWNIASNIKHIIQVCLRSILLPIKQLFVDSEKRFKPPTTPPSVVSKSQVTSSPSEQFKFIVDSYESFNNVLFGSVFDGVQLLESKLPVEMIRLILDYCDQKELQTMLTSCKFIYNLLRSDLYYWPQITKYQTFGQLIMYLKTHDLFLHTELYTNVGQALHYTDLKLPVMDLRRKTEFNPVEDDETDDCYSLESIIYSPIKSQSWEHPANIGTSSQLFAEEYIILDIFDVDILNLIIRTVFKLREMVKQYTGSGVPPRVSPNLRQALRDYRNFLNSHPRLKLLLRARENENLEMNGPIEQESREDELPKPIDNSLKILSESDRGKPIAYSCLFCKAKVGGFTCVKCNELLLVDTLEGTAKCPKCTSSIQRPNCCNKEMQPETLGWTIHPSTNEPHFPCKCSAISCRCFACCSKDVNPEGSDLIYNHFYRRVWEADVFTCSKRCKGTYYEDVFTCNSCHSKRGLSSSEL